MHWSFIEIKVFLRASYHCLVRFIEILLRDHVSIFTYCLHSGLLTDACYIGSTDLVRPTHILLQINILSKIHLRCNCLENQTLLSSVGEWKFNFPIESARSKEGWIKCICSVGWHNNLHIYILFKTIHLIQQFNEYSLNLPISSCLSIKTPE